MLTRVQALHYRALRSIDQPLSPFQILIGPNASGKSTFLDVVSLIGDVVTQSPATNAIAERAADVRDLTWVRAADWFEVAVEAEIPADFNSRYQNLRYELRLGMDENSGEVGLLVENLWLLSDTAQPSSHRRNERLTIPAGARTPNGWRKIVGKVETGNDYFKSESTDWNNQFRLGPRRSALANLPEDDDRFPVSTWFKRYISESIQRIALNSQALRRPSPPGIQRAYLPDGSNLPWVIHELEQRDSQALSDWVAHIQTALPDIVGIRTVERPEDRHRYLVIEYASGLTVPSWVVSDGTLRLLALTLLAYIQEAKGIYLIEEPENGIHPRAVETVLQSLSSVYGGQVLLATHSPVVLSMAKAEDLLCFERTADGETTIVRGDQHPKLSDWKGDVSLDVLFAAGVLG
ncbi:MAG: AAA family ATPase [Anaerolineae bacterium]|nr:AAA family ATPase [Anaerolineae bacterium]